MDWTNYHVHTNYCHGVGEPEDYINEGLARGLKSIGFSSHAPLPFYKSWAMSEEGLRCYCKHINLLKSQYKDKIQIFLGLEVDFIPDMLRFDSFRALGVDYIIGSNHFIGKYNNGMYRRLEAEDIRSIIGDNVQTILENYYRGICNMVSLEKPDIIGHMDLIKKINIRDKFFREDEIWYRQLVNETLAHIAKSNTIVEVNTSNLIEKSADYIYPSVWILEKCYALGIPITLSADAHRPENIISGFEEAAEILKDIGFEKIAVLTPDGWKLRKLNMDI